MGLALKVSPETEEWVREIVRDELNRDRPRERRVGAPPSEMEAVWRRIDELRTRIAMDPDELEELLEEHRREMGRGPLVDEPGDAQ
jgi:hypothetical protein